MHQYQGENLIKPHHTFMWYFTVETIKFKQKNVLTFIMLILV